MSDKTNKQLLEEIHRGLYGDEKNGVNGLIKRQAIDEDVRQDHEGRISVLERFKVNVMLSLGGLGTALSGFITFLYLSIPWKKVILFFEQLK